MKKTLELYLPVTFALSYSGWSFYFIYVEKYWSCFWSALTMFILMGACFTIGDGLKVRK